TLEPCGVLVCIGRLSGRSVGKSLVHLVGWHWRRGAGAWTPRHRIVTRLAGASISVTLMTALARGGIGIGQVLGALWILAVFGLLISLVQDLRGQATPYLLVFIGVELAIPAFVGFRLIRRPTARLARWSAVLAAFALFDAVMFA